MIRRLWVLLWLFRINSVFELRFEDDAENMYDIEMQTYWEDAPLLRSRYYQSLNDLACLGRGDPFTALKESYI